MRKRKEGSLRYKLLAVGLPVRRADQLISSMCYAYALAEIDIRPALDVIDELAELAVKYGEMHRLEVKHNSQRAALTDNQVE